MNWRCGKDVYSRQFKIGESAFRFRVYPNGDSPEKKGHIAVYLANESGWKVKCSVTFTAMGHKKTTACYIEQDQQWGFPGFVSHEDMDG